MKVLLYETGNIGHRPVYRQYYKSALEQVGVEVELHCEPDYKKLFGFNNCLQKLAAERRCDLIHILTLDDHTRRMFASRAAVTGCAVIGTYYLYQNISHIYKGWAIRQLFKQGKINVLVVPSAMEIVSPKIFEDTNLKIFPLPDPIENPAHFNMPKQEARKKLELPCKWKNATILLVFGALGKRRGLQDIIKMLLTCSPDLSGMRFLFAGKIDHSCLSRKDSRSLVELLKNGVVHLIDRWLTSAEVADVFAAADLFLTMNEKKFQGASSTVGRAVKAGLTIVAPSDSVAGICAKACGRAELFRRGNADDFIQCIRRASTNLDEASPSSVANVIPLTVDIDEFGRRLLRVYTSIA